MSFARQTLALATLALLAACEQTPTENTSAPANSSATIVRALPAFAVDSKTALAQIATYGPPWSAATPGEPMEDPATGGRATVMTGPDGSAQVFSRVEGTVWQVRLVTGTPGSCGSSAPLIAAFPKVVEMLAPGTVISPAIKLEIGNGMTDLKPTTRELPGMRITVVGGCSHWLTVAVPDKAAAASPSSPKSAS